MDEERRDQPPHEEQEAGIRGGAASYAVEYHPGAEAPAIWAETVVRWSPIWVGLLVTFGISLVISILGLAIALSTAEAGAPEALATDILQTATIWNVIGSLIALFVGGMLAGRLGVHAGHRSGWTQGTVLWSLYLLLTIFLAMLGFTGLASGLSGVFNINALTSPTAADISPAQAAATINNAAYAAWWFFAGILITWIAAVSGAIIGQKSASAEHEQH